MGQDTNPAPDLFVNMLKADETPADTFAAVAQCIAECAACCKKIRNKAAMSSASIALHQICSVVTQTFCVYIRLPDPGETYGASGMLLEDQRACIRDILDVCMQFVSACKSKNSDQGMDLSQAITMGAILTVTDAIIRIEPSDQPSALFQVISGRADAMLEMAKPAPAEGEAEEELKCPQGHPLKEAPFDDHWCDLCTQRTGRRTVCCQK